jgi:hypothetical protein
LIALRILAELVVPMGRGGGYKVHGSRRIFLGFHGEEIGGGGRRTESVTWSGPENGGVFAMRGRVKGTNFLVRRNHDN